ncbi:MAG: hypothetical protein ACI8PG_004598, partial [Planctomycetota bacterium]
RDPSIGGDGDSFTTMRTRLQAKATLERQTSAFIQWQDVRLWGEESNTLGDFDADHIDVHQAYIDFKNFADYGFDLRLGRQEINLGGQRLVGAVGWTSQGRSFDGARLALTPGGTKIDLLGIRLADATAATHDDNAYLAGAYATLPGAFNLELYLLYNSAGAATDQITLGLRRSGKAGAFPYRVEAAYQTGERDGQDVAALLVGLRAGTKLGKGTATLWYDYLSGDDDPGDGETKVFDTLFATNHKFYGTADLFLNIPVHTASRGLQDIAFKLSWPLGAIALKADIHSFSLVEKGGLDSAHLGEEIDLTLSHKYSANVGMTAGLSRVLADDSLAAIDLLADDATWAFFMVDARF